MAAFLIGHSPALSSGARPGRRAGPEPATGPAHLPTAGTRPLAIFKAVNAVAEASSGADSISGVQAGPRVKASQP
jgi:hypothetical protein